MELDQLRSKIIEFRDLRAWQPFHTAENLAKSISIEAGELLEHFQWGGTIDREAVVMEMSDVFIYLLLLEQTLQVDIVSAAANKISLNEKRYPVQHAFGRATGPISTEDGR